MKVKKLIGFEVFSPNSENPNKEVEIIDLFNYFTCDNCGEESKDGKHVISSFAEDKYCFPCYNEIIATQIQEE